jgi:uncharacterized protein involved in outer membrane biogenesis
MRIPERWQQGWLDWRSKRFWLLVAIALYALAGFVVAPWYARGAIVDAIRSTLGLEARLADVDVNPFAMSARLEDFAIAGRDGEDMVRLHDLYVNFELSSLFHRAFTFAELRIVEPYVDVERSADGRINLMALAPANDAADAPAREDAASEPVRLIVHRVELLQGRADVADRTGREPFATSLGPIDLAFDGFSTLPDRHGEQEITIVGEHGATLSWKGSLALNPFSSSGEAKLTGLPLERFSAFLPADVRVAIASGTADASLTYAIDAGRTLSATLSDAALTVRALRIDALADGGKAPLLELPALSVTGGRFEWPARALAVERIAIEQPSIALGRGTDGRFTWQTLTTPAPIPSEPTPDAPAAGTAMKATLGRFDLTGGSVRFVDGALEPAATFSIDSIDVGIDSLSLADGARMPFTLKASVDGGGTAVVRGEVQIRPVLAVTANVDVKGLALATAQPYIAQATVLSLDSGTADIAGDVALPAGGAMKFTGAAAVADFSLTRADAGDRIAEWKRLAFEGIDADAGARRVELARIALESVYARVRIDKSGEINVSRLLTPRPPTEAIDAPAAATSPAPPAAAPAEPWTVRLARFDLSDGSSDFRDESLPIPFVAKISDFDGKLTALDSSSKRPADITFEGKVGDYGLVRVAGALQPLAFDENTRFDAKFQNIELRDATPYSVQFAGHEIASGKLDLDTHYEVQARQLRANHDIVLRDFTLGRKVESPEAMDLPLQLAISLLKGPDGNIEVELPIEGRVDDPQFRIGGIIWKAIGNLITKIVTSPFRLLGNLIGMGDDADLDRVEFAPGRADLTPPEMEKIAKLAEALRLRPELRLDVPAVSSTELDSAALRRARVSARIDAATAGLDPAAVRHTIEALAASAITPEERAAIEARHTTTKSESAPAAFDEAAYVGELTDRMVEREPIAPADIAALANARRDAVVAALLAQADITAERARAADAVEVKPDGEAVPLVFAVDARAAPTESTPSD